MQLPNAGASLATRGESRMNAGGNYCGKPLWLLLSVVIGGLLLGVYSSSAWALQRHTLPGQSSRSDVRHGETPDQTAGAPETPIAQERAGVTSPSAPPGHEQAPHTGAPATPQMPPAKAEKHEAPSAAKEAAHGAGAEKEAHGE